MMNLPPGVAQSLISINGEIKKPHEAHISIFDRGFLYGDSVYEVTYAEQGGMLFFEEHLDRLFQSAQFIGLESTFSKEQIAKNTLDLLKKQKPTLAYVRIVLTRGISEISLDPASALESNLIIISKPYPAYPKDWYEVGQSMMFSTYLRNDKSATNPNAKSGNYLNNILALKEAKSRGFNDAILFNKEGYATEGTTNNIWIVKNGILSTPNISDGLLQGITRDKIFELCKKNNVPVVESHLTKIDILEADEIFYTSSTKGLVPINRIEDRSLPNGMGPMTKKVAVLYEAFVQNSLHATHYRYL